MQLEVEFPGKNKRNNSYTEELAVVNPLPTSQVAENMVTISPSVPVLW